MQRCRPDRQQAEKERKQEKKRKDAKCDSRSEQTVNRHEKYHTCRKVEGRNPTLAVLPARVFVDGIVVPKDVETEQPHDQRVDGRHQPEDTKIPALFIDRFR